MMNHDRRGGLFGIQLVFLGKPEGDQRNPAVWQAETMQDVVNELHSRNTSFQVGLAFERRSRAGLPTGKMPEVYEAASRAPSILGRRGSVNSWRVTEPMASILKEGCARYLAGASFAELARWSGATELAGRTPRGRVMNKRWWYTQLHNQRYAGYQWPTNYAGYQMNGRVRGPLSGRPELVPFVPPALWGMDEYREILRLGAARSSGPKPRYRYRPYLLSSIAVDARCGHHMKVDHGPTAGGRYTMRCSRLGPEGGHSPSVRADVAELELDALLAGLSFDDPELQRQIAEELRNLERAEQSERASFRADPAIGAARQALAALGSTEGFAEVRGRLEAQIEALQAGDAQRRDLLDAPVVGFRRALESLKEWDEVWRDADMRTKNELLREAGVTVQISPDEPFVRGRPAHIRQISAENSAFALALGVGLSRSATLGQVQDCYEPNVAIALPIGSEVESPAARLAGFADGLLVLERPSLSAAALRRWRIPEPDGGPWLTTGEFADLTATTVGAVTRRIYRGRIPTVRVKGDRRRWWYLIRDPRAEPDPDDSADRPSEAHRPAKAA